MALPHRRNRLLAFISLFLLLTACQKEQPPVKERIRALKTVTVAEIASGQVRKFSGIVQADDASGVSFQVGGNVAAVKAELGDQVKKGQLLALLDDKPYRLSVKAAEAALGQAKAELKEAELEYGRKSKLHAKGWVSQAAIDQVTARRETAQSQVRYAKSQLNLARRDLGNTELRAPFDGVIAKREVDSFVEVAAGKQVFEINADGAMEVAMNIPETVISQVAPGMPASVSFAGIKGEVVYGRITEIGSVAGEANAFPVKASLIDPPPGVRAGMTANVSIALQGKAVESAFLIPFTAVAPGGANRTGHVFVYDPESSTVRKKPIRIEGVRDNLLAVHEGLNAGEIIAVAGVTFLHDGQKVKLLER